MWSILGFQQLPRRDAEFKASEKRRLCAHSKKSSERLCIMLSIFERGKADGGLFFDPVMVSITSGTTGAKIY